MPPDAGHLLVWWAVAMCGDAAEGLELAIGTPQPEAGVSESRRDF
jgi:hypothetical protein